MNYLYIIGTIIFTVYGLIILKWQMLQIKVLPDTLTMKLFFLTKLIFTNPYIFSGILSAYLASLCWMAAMTKFDLSFAYPFTGFNFVMILILSCIFFNDPFTANKAIGTALIVLGIYISVR